MPDIPTHDLVVYGSCAGGIACAVRAAREGLSVLLVVHTPHLGGMLTSGLCVWDTVHEGRRAPIYDELRAAMIEHYRATYGEGSPQHLAAVPGKHGHSNGNFEPRVAQQLVEALVARERRITVRRRCIPVATRREGRALAEVTFGGIDGGGEFTVTAAVFADCSYEGDLMALAGVPYRVGRESRAEHGEPHAGRLHMRHLPADAVPPVPLNLRTYPGTYVAVDEPGAGDGDDLVQAFNWRTVLTDDPSNRMPIPAPARTPEVDIAALERIGFSEGLPNRKVRVNRPQLIGRQNAYVEGDWNARRAVMDEHWDAFLALMRFLQSDPSLSEEARRVAREWGLARDEFADNCHRPYEIYARETRRMRGRATFSQHDATLAPGLSRAPVHADSIAATEWYMDVHACTDHRLPGTLHEGKVILYGATLPGQVPFRALLPEDLDNLLVPVCVSSTHVGWGTIRLEPTWMNIGESAGTIAAIAVRRGVPPATLLPDDYQPALARSGVMLGFFNDCQPGDAGSDAAQYFSARGFFAGYDARLDAPLTADVAAIWVEALHLPTGDPIAVARRVAAAGERGTAMTADGFRRLLPAALASAVRPGDRAIGRREALDSLFSTLLDVARSGGVAATARA